MWIIVLQVQLVISHTFISDRTKPLFKPQTQTSSLFSSELHTLSQVCCFLISEKAKLAEQSRHVQGQTIAEETIITYKSNNQLNTTNHNVPPPVPKEERLQPIGASDPKHYNDSDQTCSGEHNSSQKQQGVFSFLGSRCSVRLGHETHLSGENAFANEISVPLTKFMFRSKNWLEVLCFELLQ